MATINCIQKCVLYQQYNLFTKGVYDSNTHKLGSKALFQLAQGGTVLFWYEHLHKNGETSSTWHYQGHQQDLIQVNQPADTQPPNICDDKKFKVFFFEIHEGQVSMLFQGHEVTKNYFFDLITPRPTSFLEIQRKSEIYDWADAIRFEKELKAHRLAWKNKQDWLKQMETSSMAISPNVYGLSHEQLHQRTCMLQKEGASI